MRKTLLLLGLAALTGPAAFAQTTLSAGDLVILTVNSSAPDLFSFAPLVALAPNTVIKFTDNGSKANGDYRTNEGTITWTTPTAVPAFTIISVTPNPSANTAGTSSWPGATVTMQGAYNGAAGGDQLTAYQVGADTTALYAVNWVGDWSTTGNVNSNQSYIPAGLSTAANTAVDLGTSPNYTYTGPTDPASTNNGDPATLRTLVANTANWTGAATAQSAPIGTNGLLPVELVSFTAAANGRSARLSWMTASETNNAGFTVEQQRGEMWTDVSTLIAGHGTTTERQSYSFSVDGLTAGTHTFRLRQTDTDGTVHYSAPTSVEIGVSGKGALTLLGSRAVRIETNGAQAVRVSVVDVLGRTVALQSVAVDGTVEVALPSLLSGTYFVRATGERFSATKTLVVR